MQKTTYTFVLLLSLILAGCAKVEFTEPAPGGENDITFRIKREQNAVTRASLAEGNAIVFQKGDRISVFDGDNTNCEFTLAGDPDSSSVFTGKVGLVANSYLVLYPYMPEVKATSDKIGTIGNDDERRPVIIPAQQKAVEDSFDPDAFISVARSVKVSNSEHDITLRNACALVKFTIPDELDGLTFEKAVLESEYVIAGAVRVNPDGTSDYAGPGSTSITLTGTMKSGHSYYFCTLARAIEGLSISLFHYPDDTSPIVVKATDGDITLVRNKVLNLGTIDVTDMPSKDGGWYGSGTTGDPYQISTVDDMKLLLERLADDDNPQYRGLSYRMTDDIDCDGDSLIVNGKEVEFCGLFDGNGHTLSNYRTSIYNKPYSSNQPYYSYDYCGLFHRVYGATFRNLTLRPADMTAVLHTYNYVSPFISVVDVAGAQTLIDNCRIEGEHNLAFCNWGDVMFGGFVGFNYSDNLDFVNCCNDADYTFSEYTYIEINEDNYRYEHTITPDVTFDIGGFIGCMYNKDADSTTDFDRCRNSGDITLSLNLPESNVHCGGFIGKGDYGFLYANTFSFTNCVNSGAISINPGNDCSSVYASGFVGFSEINGRNSAGDRHLPAPHLHNCLNKGGISASGKDAHAAGFAYYSKHEGYDNNLQFRLCINIGAISAVTPDITAPYAAAISSGYGNCRWCWWLDSSPMLPVTLAGNPNAGTSDINKNPYYCMHYPTINADTPNNRRTGTDGKGGTDIVLNENNSQWNSAQWKALTVAWVGGSKDRSLDLDF